MLKENYNIDNDDKENAKDIKLKILNNLYIEKKRDEIEPILEKQVYEYLENECQNQIEYAERNIQLIEDMKIEVLANIEESKLELIRQQTNLILNCCGY